MRRTFLEGREEGERVDVEAGTGTFCVVRLRDGGPRRVDAADGGGLSVLPSLGRGRRALVWGLEDGGMRRVEGRRCSRGAFDVGREGGGIVDRSCCGVDLTGDRGPCAVCLWVFGLRWKSSGRPPLSVTLCRSTFSTSRGD